MLRFVRFAALFSLSLAVLCDQSAFAQKKKNKKPKSRNDKQAFLDAKSAGPDFQVQGEYVGAIGKTKTGRRSSPWETVSSTPSCTPKDCPVPVGTAR